MRAATRLSARLARSTAHRTGVDVVEVWPSLLARPSRRWRTTRWAPNCKRVGAQEQGHRDRGYVVAKTRRQTERRLTVVVARRGGAPEVLEAI